MMAAMHATALALPRLDASIPFEYRVPGDSGICAPLALALLESPALGDEAFSLAPNALLVDVFADLHERDLATRALSRWWDDLQRRHPTKMFKWVLQVLDENDFPDRHGNTRNSPPGKHAWFCISRDQNDDIPRVSLARAVEELEKSLEGFGQTVLAVLDDALCHLPESFTPQIAHRAAYWLHWSESENDEELLALARENGTSAEDVLTRAMFFEQMPQWVVAPRRTVAKDEIVRAAREGFERQVIAACDAISGLACHPGFKINPSQCGTEVQGYDSVDGMAVISWKQFDTPGDVIDDLLNHIGQAGEYVDFIDMQCVKLSGSAVGAWMSRTENMVHLAQLTENLLTLIGEPF